MALPASSIGQQAVSLQARMTRLTPARDLFTRQVSCSLLAVVLAPCEAQDASVKAWGAPPSRAQATAN